MAQSGDQTLYAKNLSLPSFLSDIIFIHSTVH